MVKHLRISLIAILLFPGTAVAQSVLDNDSVAKMATAGLGDDVIVSMINSQPGKYAVDPDAVIKLKQSGLSEKIINAMIAKNSGGSSMTPVATPAAATPVVDEVGVYFKDKDNKWVEMLPEVVNWKTGGALKRFASDGIVKGDVNGHLEGKA